MAEIDERRSSAVLSQANGFYRWGPIASWPREGSPRWRAQGRKGRSKLGATPFQAM
jgi:hypothetical protein